MLDSGKGAISHEVWRETLNASCVGETADVTEGGPPGPASRASSVESTIEKSCRESGALMKLSWWGKVTRFTCTLPAPGGGAGLDAGTVPAVPGVRGESPCESL